MGQFAAYGLLQFYFFQHHFPPSSVYDISAR
jgi:hypothetical protein